MTRVNHSPPWYVWLFVVANIAVSVIVNTQLTRHAVRDAACAQATTWDDLYLETPPSTPSGRAAMARMRTLRAENC